MKRTSKITALILVLLVASLAMGCNAPRVQIDAKTTAAAALATNLVMVWTAADVDKDGTINHAELAAAALRTLNEISRAYPDVAHWEGRMKTEQGRQEFVEALIVLYVQYATPEPAPTPTP